jgi:hypothetical protein
MAWSPISHHELEKLIQFGQNAMNLDLLRFWSLIRIEPTKWQETSYGSEGGGFWVVAIIGNQVLWYNDIEDGFNLSSFSELGRIKEYRCNHSELHWVVKHLYDVTTGQEESAYIHLGPPEPLD